MADIEPYTRINTTWLDQQRRQLSGEAFKLLLVAARKTAGWHKPDDRISISQFIEETGSSRASVIKSTRELVARSVLIKHAANKKGTEYTLNMPDPALGFTAYDNRILDKILRFLTGNEAKIVSFFYECWTYEIGFSIKEARGFEYDKYRAKPISYRAISAATTIPLQSVKQAVKDLEEHLVISLVREARGQRNSIKFTPDKASWALVERKEQRRAARSGARSQADLDQQLESGKYIQQSAQCTTFANEQSAQCTTPPKSGISDRLTKDPDLKNSQIEILLPAAAAINFQIDNSEIDATEIEQIAEEKTITFNQVVTGEISAQTAHNINTVLTADQNNPMNQLARRLLLKQGLITEMAAPMP